MMVCKHEGCEREVRPGGTECSACNKRRWRAENPEKARAGNRRNLRRWRAENPEMVRESRTRTHYRRRYGLELDEVERLKAGGCMLCEHTDPAHMCIDHDHDAPRGREAVRGVLCQWCNRTLGTLEKGWPVSDDWVLRATQYLCCPPFKRRCAERVPSTLNHARTTTEAAE